MGPDEGNVSLILHDAGVAATELGTEESLDIRSTSFSKAHILIHGPLFSPRLAKHADENVPPETWCGHPVQISYISIRSLKLWSEAFNCCSRSCWWLPS